MTLISSTIFLIFLYNPMVLCLLFEIVTFVSFIFLNMNSYARPFLLENNSFVCHRESNLINLYESCVMPLLQFIIKPIAEYIDTTVLQSQCSKVFFENLLSLICIYNNIIYSFPCCARVGYTGLFSYV